MEAAKAGGSDKTTALLMQWDQVKHHNSNDRILAALFTAIASNNTPIAKLLIERGSKGLNLGLPYHTDKSKRTALREAVLQENKEIVDILLKNSNTVGNIDRKDKFGRTALHDAASLGATGIMAELIFKGANINAVDKQHMTPLHVSPGAQSHIPSSRMFIEFSLLKTCPLTPETFQNRHTDSEILTYRGWCGIILQKPMTSAQLIASCISGQM